MSMRTVSRALVLTLSLSLAVVAGCEDSSSGGEGEGEGEGEGGEGEGELENENRVEAQVAEEGGESHEESKSQAEPTEDFGAIWSGPILTLYFASSTGTVWTFVVDTEASPIPGRLAVTDQDGAVHGSYTSLAGGTPVALVTPGGGYLHINQCPTAAGQSFSGRFEDIIFSNEAQGSITMNGDFELVVRTSSGSLVCQASEGEGEGEGEGESCSFEACEDEDANCCPYVQCMNNCIVTCAMECGMNPTGCFGCITTCWEDDCNASQACRDAAAALDECSIEASCGGVGGEIDEACQKANCCDELEATY